MSLLESIGGPRDIRNLSRSQLEGLATEIRSFLVSNVSRTGGHLGPNLGVVELTLAIHRVFDSPHDPIIFDTGHQSYVHKIVTGRQGLFPTLRHKDGLSGYPNRAESEHDWVESSHASAALSWGEGMAKAFRLKGEDRTVVVLVGDGALTGGMSWEALNNIAVEDHLKLVIVVNDNGRSYTPTIGGLALQMQGLRTDPRYEQTLDLLKRVVTGAPLVGRPAYDLLHGFKKGLKDILAPQSLFSDLGLKYVGPIDGHDIGAVETALQQARNFDSPVIVHCMTTKGKGFLAAEQHEQDRFHAVGEIDEHTGEPLSSVHATTWTDVFSDEIVALGKADERIVGITAAMLHPVGLAAFAAEFPDRTFDVGIAEQHATASAAGLAMAGLHPVVAVYSTFLNRAFDQVLMDVALHRLGVTFVLDRAGVTGPDGASHHGMWDCSMLGMVPGLQLAAPRDETRLREALRHAVGVDDAPTVVRYGKDAIPADIPTLRQVYGMDVLFESDQRPRVLLVGVGPFAELAVAAARRLDAQGIGSTVVDPVWSLPVNAGLAQLAREHELVVTVEDALVVGGIGSEISQAVRDAGVTTPTRELGIPKRFLPHASRQEVLGELGLTDRDVARTITEIIAGLDVESLSPAAESQSS